MKITIENNSATITIEINTEATATELLHTLTHAVRLAGYSWVEDLAALSTYQGSIHIGGYNEEAWDKAWCKGCPDREEEISNAGQE